jgi:hypothetical protein
MRKTAVILASIAMFAICGSRADADTVKPGDAIGPDNSAAVADLLSPGNLKLVQQGMRLKIVPSSRLEWPPPYKAATEKYSPQVKLGESGDLQNYVAGLPFPLLDANDPTAATKAMWNFSYRPQYTDDADIRGVEIDSYRGSSGEVVEHFEIGHFAFYNNIGRVEVAPMPTDPEADGPGIRYRFGAFPFLDPEEIRGFGLVRYRNKDPKVDDNAWFYNPTSRHLRRVRADELSDAIGAFYGRETRTTYANNIDPDSYFGFAAKIENYNYKLIGLKPMLASVHAESIPATACAGDGHRSICPEAWEMRQLYVIEATAKPLSWSQKIGSSGVSVPRRILYIDSEGWFITASDQYDGAGKLWKTIATFNTYRDRPVADAKVAVYPFKRIFQTALVDEDLQDGFSSVITMPGRESPDHESWYINMGTVTQSFLDPHQMTMVGH